MKILEKNQMSSVYGGREVIVTEHTSNNGGCQKDKIVIRNNGTVVMTQGPC